MTKNKLILFACTLFALTACGGASGTDSNGVILSPNSVTIAKPNGVDEPVNNYQSVAGDADIYVGPVTCGNYRVAFDERLQKYGYADDESYNNFKEAFNTAIQAWNDAVGFELFTVVKDDTCVKNDITVRVDLDWFDPSKSGVAHPESTGAVTWTRKASGPCSFTIDFNPNAAGNWKTIAHELGHTVGFDHNTVNPNSLMSTYYNVGGDISIELIDLVKEHSDPNLVGPEDVVAPLKAKCDAGEVK